MQTSPTFSIASLTLAFSAPLLAQMPTPAPALKKLERMVGTWEATGTAAVMPGMPPMPWTATNHVRWDLGGHALVDDMVIKFTGAPMGPLVMRTYVTYDKDAETYRTFVAQNTGEVKSGTVEWLDDDTAVTMTSGIREGVPFCERWMTTYGDGTMEYASTLTMGADDPKVEIEGSAKRSDKTAQGLDLTEFDGFAMGPIVVPAEMKKLAKLPGEYTFTGVARGEGTDTMELSGTTSITSLFGGTVLMFVDRGESIPYAGHHYMSWNAQTSQFDHFGINDMAMANAPGGHFVGDAVVFTHATVMDGQPLVERTMMTMSDDGTLHSMTAHAIAGVADPFETFTGTYTSAPGAADATAGKGKDH